MGDMARRQFAQCFQKVTDLLWVEISILVTVGDGDGEEVIMGAAVRCQSVQCSLQFSTTRRLWEKIRF